MEPNKRKPNRPSGAAEDVELSSQRQQATNVYRLKIKREHLRPKEREGEGEGEAERERERRSQNETKVGAN